MDHIGTMRDRLKFPPWSAVGVLDATEFVELVWAQRGRSFQLPGTQRALSRFGDDVEAYVNGGFVKAMCLLGGPLDPCLGVEDVDPDDPRFFCLSCYNGGRGVWRRVVFPDDYALIERVLLARPRMSSRNWWAAGPRYAVLNIAGRETLEDLKAENLRHGDPFAMRAGETVAATTTAPLLEE